MSSPETPEGSWLERVDALAERLTKEGRTDFRHVTFVSAAQLVLNSLGEPYPYRYEDPLWLVETPAGYDDSEDPLHRMWIGRRTAVNPKRVLIRSLDISPDNAVVAVSEVELPEARIPRLHGGGQNAQDVMEFGYRVDLIGRALGIEFPEPTIELVVA